MPKKPHSRTPIVGVGASAGGVEALEGFFRGVPREPGFGVVVVTHLGPKRESYLHQIIARYTDLEVKVAEDGAEVGANCVYVLPADALIGIAGGKLRIAPMSPNRRERKPIDIFLSSLATDLGEYSAAVILSGGDGDGTLGVKAVKERGGMTMAQVRNGDGPAYPDMPDSAISTGFVDFAIPADQMGAKLVEFARGLAQLDDMVAAHENDGEQEVLADARKEIYELLRVQVGHDFTGYKAKTFLRRVQRRMQVNQLDTIDAYVERLREDALEVSALFRDLLINVTNFFRDADAFEKLKELVIPKLFENRGADDTVRVWIPGCATGEEVFSVAMLIREHMDTLRGQPRVQIFATDIDERALSVARTARYPEALLDTVSPVRLARFFIRDGGAYVLTKDVRDLCIFSPHSVIRDPPFSRIDLVSCRNLLIYFGPDLQSQVVPIFHYSLRAGGYLFLGTSENVSQFADLFTPLEKRHRIFRARQDLGGARLPLPLNILRAQTISDRRDRPVLPRGLAFRQMIESQVLEHFAPPHVVANREGEIAYYSSRTGKYLEATAGAPTRDLFSMARKGVRLDLRAVFRDAVETGRSVTRRAVEMEADDGRKVAVSISVEPFMEPGGDEPLFVVLFADELAPAIASAGGGAEPVAARLDAELRETRDRLQSVVEEYETALEELKSSNEELVSVNEELQSTNEELEASKEELQSVNEELNTVNSELHGKIEALASANSDLKNLFDNSQVAMVFLDSDFLIRMFTPAVSVIFNILPSDRGRPLGDLSSRFEMPFLAGDIRAAVEKGEISQRRLSHDGEPTHYLLRVAPYHGAPKRIDGAVVTFVDVTLLAGAEQHQRVLISELNHRVKNMLGIVISLAKRSGEEAVTLKAFIATFTARLEAMARSYELLSRENWKSASLEDLVRRELEPFGSDRVTFGGPNIRLDAGRALPLGMILHELASNAVKHGSLSNGSGKLGVGWTQDKDGTVKLTWTERGGPPPGNDRAKGFGLQLIEGQGSHTLRGKVELKFDPKGLEAGIVFREEAGRNGNA